MRHFATLLLILALFTACDDDSSNNTNNLNNGNNTNNSNNVNNSNNTNNVTECPADFALLTEYQSYQGLIACLEQGIGDPADTITAFIQRVEQGSGFPIREGTTVVFAYYADPAYDQEDDEFSDEDFDPNRRLAPIAVSGDFNGWAEDDPAYHLTAAGNNFF
ncbi:hypothetical protein KJ865_02305, partial [Myxococcota bacterium]|nr:hypothetical protein [Myxococcota bacterium]